MPFPLGALRYLALGCDSVRAVGVGLVVCRDRLFRDAAVGAGLEAGGARPVPDFFCAGLPLRTGDLGAWLPRPGQPDGLGDELGGTPVRFMASSANTARESCSTVRPGCSRSSARTVSASSSRLKTPAGLSNRPGWGRAGRD